MMSLCYSLRPAELQVFSEAFQGACAELREQRDLDLSDCEHLGRFILASIRKGESNPGALRRRAMIYITNAGTGFRTIGHRDSGQ